MMRQKRHQRLVSYQVNKQNEEMGMNLPSLKSTQGVNGVFEKTEKDIDSKKTFHLNFKNIGKGMGQKKNKERKKTFLNLCTKKDFNNNVVSCRNYYSKKNLDNNTTLQSQNSHISMENGNYLTCRERVSYKSTRNPTTYVIKSMSEIQHKKESILSNHRISQKMRAKMVDWMFEIVQAYNCKTETLFLAIHLMDEYFKKCTRSLAITQLHVIGVSCIFIACKYEQIHPIMLKVIYKDIGHQKIPIPQILARQSDILHMISFSFQRNCPYLISRQILYYFNDLIPEASPFSAILEKNLQYYLRLVSLDPHLIEIQSGDSIAKSCILSAIRTISNCSKSSLALHLYDNFISICGKQYEKYNQICGKILSLSSNVVNMYGNLENIQKFKKCLKTQNIIRKPPRQILESVNYISKNETKRMIQSCAL